MHPIAIAPSILSADFAHLARECDDVAAGGADFLHVDVMDGRFVPNLTLGAPIVGCLKRATRLELDCHLMVEEPDHLLDDFARAGARWLSVHLEACRHLHRTVQRIAGLGMSPGVALNPHSSFAQLQPILPFVDFVLVMSVNPGYGGQAFIPETLDKVRAIDVWRRDHRPGLRIEIDGGMTPTTIGAARQAGVDWFVAGSAVFGKPDRAAAIAELRKMAG